MPRGLESFGLERRQQRAEDRKLFFSPLGLVWLLVESSRQRSSRKGLAKLVNKTLRDQNESQEGKLPPRGLSSSSISCYGWYRAHVSGNKQQRTTLLTNLTKKRIYWEDVSDLQEGWKMNLGRNQERSQFYRQSGLSILIQQKHYESPALCQTLYRAGDSRKN